MKFKIDENLPATAAAVLRKQGHDALLVLDQVAAGTADRILADLVRRESRVLVTLDLDFADIRTYRPSEFAGIIVLRPRQLNAPSVLALVERLAVALKTQSPVGQLWVVEDERIRIRGDSS